MATWNFAIITAFCGCLLACGSKPPPEPVDPDVENARPEPPSVQSNDIMAREPVANWCKVRHILISWRDLDTGRGMDPRAKQRSRAEADELVTQLHERIKQGEDFQALMAEYSEDPSSAAGDGIFDVAPDAQLVSEFKRMSLRLNVGESGIVLSDFGWHIIIRVE